MRPLMPSKTGTAIWDPGTLPLVAFLRVFMEKITMQIRGGGEAPEQNQLIDLKFGLESAKLSEKAASDWAFPSPPPSFTLTPREPFIF